MGKKRKNEEVAVEKVQPSKAIKKEGKKKKRKLKEEVRSDSEDSELGEYPFTLAFDSCMARSDHKFHTCLSVFNSDFK